MYEVLKRDRVAAVLFGAALLLVLFNGISALLLALLGMAFFGLVNVAMLLTGAFAVVGAVFGLIRGMMSTRSRG